MGTRGGNVDWCWHSTGMVNLWVKGGDGVVCIGGIWDQSGLGVCTARRIFAGDVQEDREQSCPEKVMKWESRVEEKSQEAGDTCLEKGIKWEEEITLGLERSLGIGKERDWWQKISFPAEGGYLCLLSIAKWGDDSLGSTVTTLPCDVPSLLLWKDHKKPCVAL